MTAWRLLWLRRIAVLLAVLAVVAGCDGMKRDPLIELDDGRAASTREAMAAETRRPAGAERRRAPDDRPAKAADDSESQVPLAEPEFYRGSGEFLGSARARAQVTEGAGGYTLNFDEADIRKVVDTVLGGALGENYVVDPQIKGTITARTSRPLPRELVVPALEDILAMNGAALVRDAGIYRVVPLQQAGGSAPVFIGERSGAKGYGLHVIPLDYAPADELRQTLQSFVAPGRSLQADVERNLLLFRGPGGEAQDLVDMAELFDVDWMAGMSFALLPLESAEAKDVVRELAEVFGKGEGGPAEGLLRFLPISRMNAILVISPQPDYLGRVRDWVERLDRGGAEDQRQLFVYKVQNGRAQDLASVLGEVFQVSTVNTGNRRGGEVAPGLQAAELGGLTGQGIGGNASGGTNGGADGGTNGGAAAGGGGQQGGGAARPSTTAPSREPGANAGRARRGTGALGGGEDGPRIIADGRNNALLILATAREFRMIENTLERLDVVPLQVLIEATIAEVTLTDDLRYGVRWFLQSEAEGTGTGSVTFSDVSTGAVSSTFPGFSFLFEGGDVSAALNALEEVTNVNVVSSPQLMVLDNETARLNVGDQVPVATQSSVSTTDADSPIVNSIEFRDTGVILEITPRVSNSGLVTMDVSQEVSDVVETTTSNIDSPTIQQRSISSSVAVQTGETIALGGLIRDRQQDAVSGVPLLKDIPIFGNLFKSTDRAASRTELLVLITPRVVRDPNEAREVTRELRQRLSGIENLQRRVRRGYGSSAPQDDDAPPAPRATPEDAPSNGARTAPGAEEEDETTGPQASGTSPDAESEPPAVPVAPVETEAPESGSGAAE